MTDQPSQVEGAPSWLQHSSSDPAEARKFYERVLGWTVNEMPMKDGSSYAAILVGGQPVGGFAPGGDAGWLTYITVENVDRRLEEARAAGAKVVADAVTVPGVGRMATIADPFGGRIAFIDYTKA